MAENTSPGSHLLRWILSESPHQRTQLIHVYRSTPVSGITLSGRVLSDPVRVPVKENESIVELLQIQGSQRGNVLEVTSADTVRGYERESIPVSIPYSAPLCSSVLIPRPPTVPFPSISSFRALRRMPPSANGIFPSVLRAR